MKGVLGLLGSVLLAGVLAVPFAEATSTPLPPLMRYRVAWEVIATGLRGHGGTIFATREAAQRDADALNRMHAGVIWHWVEAVDMTTLKVTPLPPLPLPPLPAGPGGGFVPPPPPVWDPYRF